MTFSDTLNEIRKHVPASGKTSDLGVWSAPTAARAIGLALYDYDTGVIRSAGFSEASLLEAILTGAEPSECLASAKADETRREFLNRLEAELNRKYGGEEDYFPLVATNDDDANPSSRSGETNALVRYIIASAIVSEKIDVHAVTVDYLTSEYDYSEEDIGSPVPNE